jgi:hypothetical protein
MISLVKRLCAAAILFACATAPYAAPQTSAVDAIKTKPEQTNFEETSRYDDVVAFLNELTKVAPKAIRVKSFGATHEGRSLPLAVVGAADASVEAVRRTGKVRVYIQGNIHAGEVEGKESAQMLLRDLVAGRREEWLDKMVFLVAPIFNADGNEKVALNNRGPQYGPMGGQGTRANAQGLNINRDHMKLDTPEAQAFVRLMNEYDPHVLMDLHTTNGTRHAYYLTYAPPLNPTTDPTIVDLLRKQWFPWLTDTVRQKHGWDFYYYGNLSGGRGNQERAWRSFDHRPRFNNNYIGLRNRFGLLSEAYAYATFQDRITATNRFVEENLNFVAKNAGKIKDITGDADRRKVVGQSLGLRAEMAKSADSVEILLGEVRQEKHPKDGHVMDVRADVKKPEKMPEYGIFTATETERVPSFYYLLPGNNKAVGLLRAHGIVFSALVTTRARLVDIEEFQIDTNTQAQNPNEGHRERTVTGKWVATKRELPEGTLEVPMTQPLARLAFYLLEPRSDDGLVTWNFMDDQLTADPKVYSILRSRK